MASRDTEGRREIEAAKQRLAGARSHEKFVSKTLVTAKAAEETAKISANAAKTALESAKKLADTTKSNYNASKKTREDVQSQLQNTKKEVADAQQFLAEVEKRWEVIDVDAEEVATSQSEGSNNNKKRKANTETSSQESNDNSGGGSTAEANQPSVNELDSSTAVTGSSIVLIGCGLSEVNGTYKRDGERFCYPRFTKEGLWQGRGVQYEVRFKDGYWHIGIFCDAGLSGGSRSLYRSMNSHRHVLPPTTGWMTVGFGEHPAPQNVQCIF